MYFIFYFCYFVIVLGFMLCCSYNLLLCICDFFCVLHFIFIICLLYLLREGLIVSVMICLYVFPDCLYMIA